MVLAQGLAISKSIHQLMHLITCCTALGSFPVPISSHTFGRPSHLLSPTCVSTLHTRSAFTEMYFGKSKKKIAPLIFFSYSLSHKIAKGEREGQLLRTVLDPRPRLERQEKGNSYLGNSLGISISVCCTSLCLAPG